MTQNDPKIKNIDYLCSKIVIIDLMNNSIFALTSKVEEYLKIKPKDTVERVRASAYFINFILTFLMLIMHHAVVSMSPFFLAMSYLMVGCTFLGLLLYIKGKISIIQAFMLFGISNQVILTIRIVILSIVNPLGCEQAIFGNLIGSYTTLIFMTLVPRGPFYVAVLSLGSIFFAGFYDGGVIGIRLVAFFVVMEASLVIMSYFCLQAIKNIQRENVEYQANEEGILKAFHMTKEELIAYLQISRNKNGENYDTSIFDRLDEQTERNIIEAVKKRMGEKRVKHIKMMNVFPDFTKTELEICKLIASNKSAKEIVRITGKTENNISTVRGHIRRKLGLHSDDDLKEAIIKMMKKSKIYEY